MKRAEKAPFDSEELARKIAVKQVTVCVVGLGWMGLPTAALFAKAGVKVIGADINRRAVELINDGKPHISEPNLAPLVREAVSNGAMMATDNLREAVSRSDIILIIVPTLIDESKRPDYSAVTQGCREIGYGMRKGSLVMLQSTMGPGSTETFVRETLENTSGMRAGYDFGLAYSPIRASSGTVLEDLAKYKRIVGGLDRGSLTAASLAMELIAKGGVVAVQDLKAAEAAKVFENVYRDVNIALSNELAMACEVMGLDYREIRDAANTQPFCHLHLPGVGVGGHCIPVNPYFLIERASEHGQKLKIPLLARKVNDEMPDHVVGLVVEALRACRKTSGRARIAVLGISYKPNVKEASHSLIHQVAAALRRKGARTIAYDPFFSVQELESFGYVGASSLNRAVDGADCAVLATAHDEFKEMKRSSLARLMRRPAAFVDCTSTFEPHLIESEGLVYRGIGRGVWGR